jgi:methylated-DNA-[protein]-cysteine S-methyltransferase
LSTEILKIFKRELLLDETGSPAGNFRFESTGPSMNRIQPSKNKYFFAAVATVFRPMAIVWWNAPAGPRIRQIFLCGKKTPEKTTQLSFPGVTPDSCMEVAELAGRIQAFLKGEAVSFDLTLAALEVCGEFQRRVLMAEYRIPRGRISTYGRIAKHIDAPGAARAVGTSLATNPFPIVIPCHRALRADGGIGGYQGGAKMKRALLELEGIDFSDSGKACMDRAIY